MAIPSTISFRAIEIVPAIMRIIIRKDVNCERMSFRAVYSFLVLISFGPCLSNLSLTCFVERPVSR